MFFFHTLLVNKKLFITLLVIATIVILSIFLVRFGPYYFDFMTPPGVGIIDSEHADFKLAVDGKMVTKELVLISQGWSDFVFEEQYNLMSLDKLKKYIKTYHHLPGIPTEKEIIQNGLNFGEMQSKLLEKLEELTLYLIAQNKMLKTREQDLIQIKAENESLREKIGLIDLKN